MFINTAQNFLIPHVYRAFKNHSSPCPTVCLIVCLVQCVSQVRKDSYSTNVFIHDMAICNMLDCL
uniref:Uncharacterized protein n=1 Tax=Anguilla anguilla TaxID=7936 RepID=A0A0E9P5I0_ANGAN